MGMHGPHAALHGPWNNMRMGTCCFAWALEQHEDGPHAALHDPCKTT